jgi:two-component system response regulator AlgR
VHAFELEAVDYLTKPVRLARLQDSLRKTERLIKYQRGPEAESAEDVLFIQERGRTERVPLSDVLYLKAELKYVTVRTALKSYLMEVSLNEMEEKYKDRFLRIHRNALIARGAVRSLERHHDPQEGEGWAVRLHGIDELLFVSRRQLAGVREVMSN